MSNVFEMVDQIIELKEQINGISKKAMKDRTDIDSEIKAHVEATMGGEEFPPFGVQGWTPGFNDGDPCEHMSVEAISLNDMDMEGFEKFDDLSEVALDPEVDAGGEVFRKVGHLLDQVRELMEIVYTTDFQCVVYIDKETKEVTVETGHYDCGY